MGRHNRICFREWHTIVTLNECDGILHGTNGILGRADGIFFQDINSVELPTNGTPFRDVEAANSGSIFLTATDSGLQLQQEELEDKFTESFIFESRESNPWLLGYPLPPVQRTPPSRAHLPPVFCILFYCFSVFSLPFLSRV